MSGMSSEDPQGAFLDLVGTVLVWQAIVKAWETALPDTPLFTLFSLFLGVMILFRDPIFPKKEPYKSMSSMYPMKALMRR